MVEASRVMAKPACCEYVPVNISQSALPLSVPSSRKVMV